MRHSAVKNITFCTMSLDIAIKNVTLSIKNIWHNNTECWALYSECHFAECRYSESCGTIFCFLSDKMQWMEKILFGLQPRSEAGKDKHRVVTRFPWKGDKMMNPLQVSSLKTWRRWWRHDIQRDGIQMNDTQPNKVKCYFEWHYCDVLLIGIQLNGIQLIVVQLNGILLNGIQLSNILLSGILLSVSKLCVFLLLCHFAESWKT